MTRPKKSATKKAAAKTAAPTVAETQPDPAPTETPAAEAPVEEEAKVEAPATETPAEASEPAAANTEVADLLARIAELEAEKAAAATPAATIPPGEVIQREVPFGAAAGDLDPGETAPAVREVVVVPGNAPESAPEGTAAVTFLGLKGDVIHPQAVSIVVPDEPTKADYEATISEGTSYTLRLNQRTRVQPGHVKWLEGHPAYDIERA